MIALPRDQRGSALLIALLAIVLLGGLGSALVTSTMVETAISAHFRTSHELLYAAEAALEQVIADAAAAPTWTDALAATGSVNAASVPRADGGVIDLGERTSQLQVAADASCGASADCPVWRLAGHRSLESLFQADYHGGWIHTAVWLADDAGEVDGDPLNDSNGIVMARTEAFGARGGRRAIVALLVRPCPTGTGSGLPVQGSEQGSPGQPCGAGATSVLSWHIVS